MNIISEIDEIHLEGEHMNRIVHFITFANTSYMTPNRIVNEAHMFGFGSIRSINEHDIPTFIDKHSTFIKENPHGYGRWIWKPKIILDTLMNIADGDIVLYCDSGIHLNIHGFNRYCEYLHHLKQYDMLTFSCNDKYVAQCFVKRDAVESYYPEFYNSFNKYCYAGVMMVKKTKYSIQLIKDWLMLCETYTFIDNSHSVNREMPYFLGNDGDNGLFNLCLAKHKISHSIYPDETNIYDLSGNQLLMYNPTYWQSLDKFPFHCRRLRHRR